MWEYNIESESKEYKERQGVTRMVLPYGWHGGVQARSTSSRPWIVCSLMSWRRQNLMEKSFFGSLFHHKLTAYLIILKFQTWHWIPSNFWLRGYTTTGMCRWTHSIIQENCQGHTDIIHLWLSGACVSSTRALQLRCSTSHAAATCCFHDQRS